MTEHNPLLQAALDYESFGWAVIPLAEGSKVPPKDFKVEKFRHTRATRSEIKLWWEENPNYNIGILTGEPSNLFVVDHDLYKQNYNADKVLEYIPDNLVTPTVTTPRNGQHQYFLKPDLEITIGADLLPGVDYRCDGGYIVAPPSVNGNGKKYEWLISPVDTVLAPPPQEFLKLINSNINNKYILYTHDVNVNKLNNVNSVKSCEFFSIEGRRDQDIFHVANLLSKGGANPEEIYKVLNTLAKNCNPPFPLSEVDAKIKSAIERADRRTRNISAEVRDWVLLNDVSFLLKSCYEELNLVNSKDKVTARVTLSKMVKEGIIENYGNLGGQYRVKVDEAPDIDIHKPLLEEYNLRLPLGIHDWVKIHRGNIIVIAGESNSGKTGMCLNIAVENKEKKVNYLSSEMGDGTELRIRLDAFNMPLSVWDGIRFRYRTDNFPDVIEPDSLNIVDYLDEGSGGEAYKMTRRIKDIGDKLKNGIAIVCIQKKSTNDFGFGGEGTKNAARLYLTITNQNRITISKAKIWRNVNINPNGMFCDFKLVAGCNFIKSGDWGKL